MAFVTHAQNGEDVVLWRALAKVEHGFWIDVGANDPDIDSVTRVFSDAGWTGINIEPMAPVFGRLCERRPRDINLCLAIEDVEGESRYFAVGDTYGLSTGDAEQVEEYRRKGLVVEEVVVPTRTLASVWAEHVSGDVHFLKIDVEGAEERVLAGAALAENRPWIVVVESVQPVVLGQEGDVDPGSVPGPGSTHEEWEHHLLDNGYQFTLFDGLNRFYVADERAAELGPALCSPVSVLDGVESVMTRNVREGYEQLVAHLESERARAAAAHQAESDLFRTDLAVLRAEREALMDRFEAMSREREQLVYERDRARLDHEESEALLEAMRRTLSWRITSPLRAVRRRSNSD